MSRDTGSNVAELQKKVLDIADSKGITRYELSRITGYSLPLLSRWSTGKQIMKVDQLHRLCTIANITVTIGAK